MGLYAEAIASVETLFGNAAQSGVRDPRAGVLATADARGRPSARVVVLQSVDEQGFVFVTDSDSRKGRQLAENPLGALCFYWQEMREQVRIEGPVDVLSEAESDSCWSMRSRERQLAAWASEQSKPLESREVLEERLRGYRERFGFEQVSRPPRWQGYRLRPERIEFWKSGWHRLHEVRCYEKTEDGWSRSLLNP